MRGVSFEHKVGTGCTDAKFHRHCQGRWRASVSLGFDADGKRIRRRVTGSTKTAVVEAMAELREELGRAPRSSRTYTVAEAVASWLDDGLPGRSGRTKTIYKDGLAPLPAKIGHRPLRELTALEVRKGLEGLSGQLSTRSLQIARNALERALRFAQVHERVGRNVAELIEAPKGRAGRPSKSLSPAQAPARRQSRGRRRPAGLPAVRSRRRGTRDCRGSPTRSAPFTSGGTAGSIVGSSPRPRT